MKIGDKLRGLRNEHGLSVATVAEKLAVSESTYRRMETDKSFPDVEQLDKISRIYHIKFISLLPPELLQSHKNDNGISEQKTGVTKLSRKLIKQYEARIHELQNQLNSQNLMTES